MFWETISKQALWLKNNNEPIYDIFETHTESTIRANTKLVIDLIKTHKIEAKNLYIEDNKVQIKDWPHSIKPYSKNRYERESSYILLSKVNEQKFKMLNCGGGVILATDEYLKELIYCNAVAKCKIKGSKQKSYSSIDTYTIVTGPDFISYVDEKYKEFRLKALLLGMDISFEYIIENTEVKVKRYTGNSYKVIIPNFITAIRYEAFANAGIQELTLNNGLKHIGNNAFDGNKVKSIELPETVEFVCRQASDIKFTKINTNTIIIE